MQAQCVVRRRHMQLQCGAALLLAEKRLVSNRPRLTSAQSRDHNRYGSLPPDILASRQIFTSDIHLPANSTATSHPAHHVRPVGFYVIIELTIFCTISSTDRPSHRHVCVAQCPPGARCCFPAITACWLLVSSQYAPSQSTP